MAPKESIVGDTFLGTVSEKVSIRYLFKIAAVICDQGSSYPLTMHQGGTTRCYTCKLRGGLTDRDSNWRLWNADMKVYRDGAGKGEEDEEWTSVDDEIISKMERRRKAIL